MYRSHYYPQHRKIRRQGDCDSMTITIPRELKEHLNFGIEDWVKIEIVKGVLLISKKK